MIYLDLFLFLTVSGYSLLDRRSYTREPCASFCNVRKSSSIFKYTNWIQNFVNATWLIRQNLFLFMKQKHVLAHLHQELTCFEQEPTCKQAVACFKLADTYSEGIISLFFKILVCKIIQFSLKRALICFERCGSLFKTGAFLLWNRRQRISPTFCVESEKKKIS